MRKTKRTLALLLGMVMLIGMVPITAQASLIEPSTYDVTIATTKENGYEPRFPDVVYIPQEKLPAEDQADYPEGKLLVAFYKNTEHATATNVALIRSSSIQIVESKDSGKTWSEATAVIDQAQMRAWGLSTAACPAEARDPNFALLSDGTLLLTFFTTMPSSVTSDHAVYIIMSTDGGKTWNKETAPFEVQHDFTGFCAKRGDITQFANGDILVPVYGVHNNNSFAYGILYRYDAETHTLTKKGEAEVKAKNEPSGTRTPFNEVSFCATLDPDVPGTVYALARQPGYLFVSTDYGMTWTYLATEGQLHQPGLKLLPDGTIFATWSGTKQPRPIYGKIFDPEKGWNATKTNLIYKYTGGNTDMADPSGVLLGDGKTLLTIWYVVSKQAICGTFTTIEELNPTPTVKLAVGGSTALTLSGKNADKAVWSSSNSDIASVAKDGTVTGKKIGSATVTATIPGTDTQHTYKVYVLPISGITENFEDKNMEIDTLPTGWDHSPSTYKYGNSISIHEDGANRVGRLWDSSGTYTTATAWKTFEATKTITVSLKYKPTMLTNSQAISLCYDGYVPDTNGVAFLRVFNEGGNYVLKYRTSDKDWGVIDNVKITLNEWHDVKIELNEGSNKARITFGKTVTEIPLITSDSTVDRLVVGSHSKADKDEIFFIDDIVIGTSTPEFFVSAPGVELDVTDDKGAAFAGTVPNGTDKIALNVETADSSAKVTMDGKTYSGKAIPLDVGENVITLTVKTGKESKNYTVTITREEAPAIVYTDVTETDWFYDDVNFVSAEGLMNGIGGGLFSPYTTCNRAMIVTILHRLEGTPAAEDAGYDDVVSGSYYAAAVNWAHKNGIVNGYGGGKFGPEDTITHEQLITILYRYAQYKGYDTAASADLSGFADADVLSDWANAAMQWASAKQVYTGVDGKLDARSGAIRARVAACLTGFCQNVVK